jgi:hypothetical protein
VERQDEVNSTNLVSEELNIKEITDPQIEIKEILEACCILNKMD